MSRNAVNDLTKGNKLLLTRAAGSSHLGIGGPDVVQSAPKRIRARKRAPQHGFSNPLPPVCTRRSRRA
jgi:hypothetical protein